MRLFAALPLSPPAIERLTALRLRWSRPGDGLRWSTPEQWHITVQFFGELSVDQAARVAAECAKAPLPATEIALEELGMFGAKGILYVLVRASASLQQLHEQISRTAKHCGVASPSRPFRPHITLARAKGQTGQRALQHLSTPALPPFGPALRWNSGTCLLLQSTLWPQGAVYTVQARLALAEPVSAAVPETV